MLVIRKGSYDSRNFTSSDSSMPNKIKTQDAQPQKKIDKEHITIERIFRVSLEESEKFLYLELFHAQIMSQDKEIAFRIKDLDEIMINIINQPEKVK
jgi:hypothetical protein